MNRDLREAPSLARDSIRAVDTPCRFDAPRSVAAWRARAEELRLRVLASAGLRPMPARPRVRPHVTARLARRGYRVENLWFETGRGLHLAGNLYLPEGPGPFAAVLHPHGHWAEGRAADDTDGSSQAFCIHLARAGYVVLAWDMIGYNDTRSLPHDWSDRRDARLGITLLGLQLWNSIRALDFVAAHPRVDARRIGVAGASGGATQAILLGAVDDRVAASALVCMVSSRMQGGCVCENAPGLRVGTNNVELAATMAPRPLLLVSATGDWTERTPREEFPSIRAVYRRLGAEGNVANAHFDLPHNLLAESREAVYAFFARHLGGEAIREEEYAPEPVALLLSSPPATLPHGRALVEGLCREARRRARLDVEALRVMLGLGPPRDTLVGIPHRWVGAGEEATLVVHDGRPAWQGRGRALIIDVHGIGKARRADRRAEYARLSAGFLEQLSRWSGGRRPPSPRVRIDLDDYFDTYNLTDDALRVADIVTALTWLSRRATRVCVHARGRAAAWVRLALPYAPPPARVDLLGGGDVDVPCAGLLCPGWVAPIPPRAP